MMQRTGLAIEDDVDADPYSAPLRADDTHLLAAAERATPPP